MIESATLLKHLQAEVKKLEDDLRARCDADASVDAPLKAQYEAARAQKRTALTYKAWREDELTNVAVAWILAGVFVRFLEDNGLVETLHLAGPDAAGLARARDEHELFFRKNSNLTEREYLEHVFTATASLPGMKEFFDRRHNPLWSVGPTGDAAAALVNFWRKADPETGRPVHDFSDPELNTRFLGDLYQDLSETARKRYALLQTPVFVEEFILDRTLTPAIETFGFREVRMIDPTCGSGHFLLGGFSRLHRLWRQAEPAEAPAVLAQRALDQVFGVDLNPNVVAIARFRVLIAALQATGTTRMRDAFNFRINVTTGDALLHGRRFGVFESQGATQRTFDTEEIFRDELKHHYEVEDVEALHRILGQQYHAVVGNPPYITVSDAAVSELYRARFPSCHRQYSLSVPFMERFFDLAVKGDGTAQQPAGFVGQITSNSFMKRKFGKKLIEEYLPRWDLTHVIDTSGAYIPGHGTPTVILFGKNQPPVSESIRTVLGIRGEPSAPTDRAQGLVWNAIVSGVDHPGSQNEYVSVADTPRCRLQKHPWSVGGGGAGDLRATLDSAATATLGSMSRTIGYSGQTNADDALVADVLVFRRRKLEDEFSLPFVIGDLVRDFDIGEADTAIFPYHAGRLIPLALMPHISRYVWPSRTVLGERRTFSKQSYFQEGRAWWAWHQIALDRLTPPEALVFAFVGTHNHFVFNSSLKVFNRSAPFIKLKEQYQADDYLAIGAVLNSSSACFWMKQVCHCKGSTVDDQGARQTTVPFEDFYEFTGTEMASFPIPTRQPRHLATSIFKTSTAQRAQTPAATLANWSGPGSGDLRACMAHARDDWHRHRHNLIAWQEELDWQVYESFGLVDPAVPAASADAAARQVSLPEGEAVDAIPPEGIELGQRTFEIVLARRVAAGEVQTTWFERHGSTPITEIPSQWPAAYRELVERRIVRIESDPNIRLIEQPEYKRRWNTEPWDEQFQRAAREWLLARLEGYFHEGRRVCELKDGFDPSASGFVAAKQPALTTTSQLAGTAQTDAAFLAVAEQLMGGPGYSVPKLVRELVEGAAVPFVPAQRYKPSGLLKRRDWEHVWDLQRKEDAVEAEVRGRRTEVRGQRTDGGGQRSEVGVSSEALAKEEGQTSEVRSEAELQRLIRAAQKEKVGEIPVPPKYGSGDFKKSVWWSLRGKLDVPKERWISYPGAERTEDPSPVIAWAGWDHAQQARALAEYYLEAKQNYGFPPDKLKPLLAGLLDLEPWLLQWHSAVDPLAGDSPANAIRAFLDAECHALGVTRADLDTVRMG